VALDHPDLEHANVRPLHTERTTPHLVHARHSAREHGTFVAGILAAKRTAPAPAICPQCSLLVRPIFADAIGLGDVPACDPDTLAAGVRDCVDAGARILNLSVTLTRTSLRGERAIQDALDHAARRGVLVIAAAGNEGSIGGSVISRHPAAIPVVAYDADARPFARSNLGPSIGRRGLGAPGHKIVSLGSAGESLSRSGTSTAAPFVAGTAALLWSLYPNATANRIRAALVQSAGTRRPAIVPPLFNVWSAWRYLRAA